MGNPTAQVDLPDSSTSTISLFPAQHSDKPLVVIWPGFGMGGRYYKPIAQWLADHGFPAAIGELRGQGTNTAVATRSHSWSYHDMATHDYPLTIGAAKKALSLGSCPVVLLAHSMGGQIGTLFLASEAARDEHVLGMMGIGAGSPYWKHFNPKTQRTVRFGAPFMAGVSRVVGHWPGGKLDFAGYGRQPRGLLREWARFSRTDAVDHITGENYPEALQQVEVPVLYTRFNNDEDCTLASAEGLARLLPEAATTVEQLDGDLGHNKWAREPEIVGRRLVQFYDEKLSGLS